MPRSKSKQRPSSPGQYTMKPAELLPLTDECEHRQSKDEFSWDTQRYFAQRYSIFSLYDEGVLLTEDAWFGVTPEPVANQIAYDISVQYPKNQVIVDLFGGAGGNTIAFALSGSWDRVISIEKHAPTLACAQKNAEIYEVPPNIITWVHADSFTYLEKLLAGANDLHPDLKLDFDTTLLFASPPWGGPGYRSDNIFNMTNMQPYNLDKLHGAYQSFDHALFLPRTSDLRQIADCAPANRKVEVVQYCMEGASKGLVAYIPGKVATSASEGGLVQENS